MTSNTFLLLDTLIYDRYTFAALIRAPRGQKKDLCLEGKEIKQQASENVSRKSQERRKENLREKGRKYLLMYAL